MLKHLKKFVDLVTPYSKENQIAEIIHGLISYVELKNTICVDSKDMACQCLSSKGQRKSKIAGVQIALVASDADGLSIEDIQQELIGSGLGGGYSSDDIFKCQKMASGEFPAAQSVVGQDSVELDILTVVILPNMDIETVLSSVQKLTRELQESLEAEKKAEAEYADELKSVYDRPVVEPLFESDEIHSKFIAGYLKAEADQHFQKTVSITVSEPKRHPDKTSDFRTHGVENPAFQFEVHIEPDDDIGPADFHSFWERLQNVFSHSYAVSEVWGSEGEEDIYTRGINGTLAGLAADICTNDPGTAKKVAENLGLPCPLGLENA